MLPKPKQKKYSTIKIFVTLFQQRAETQLSGDVRYQNRSEVKEFWPNFLKFVHAKEYKNRVEDFATY